MRLSEQFLKKPQADGCVDCEQDEPFYAYLSEVSKTNGNDTILEIERHVFADESDRDSVYIAVTWCGDSEDESTISKRLALLVRVVREHHDTMLRKAAVDGLQNMSRTDIITKLHETEKDPGVRYRMARWIVLNGVRGLAGSTDKRVSAARTLINCVFPFFGLKLPGNMEYKRDMMRDAVNVLGAGRAATILHYIRGHDATPNQARDFLSRVLRECAPRELVTAFKKREMP